MSAYVASEECFSVSEELCYPKPCLGNMLGCITLLTMINIVKDYHAE